MMKGDETMTLHRNPIGGYITTHNGHTYTVERGDVGWNIYLEGDNCWQYAYSETLAEARETIATDRKEWADKFCEEHRIT